MIGCLREHGMGMEGHLKFLAWVSNSLAEWLDISHRLSCATDYEEYGVGAWILEINS